MTGTQISDKGDHFVDTHFHWFPRDIEDIVNTARGVDFRHSQDWYDLEGQLELLDSTGRRVDVVCSGGVTTGHFTELSLGEAADTTRAYNEAMAGAQRRHPGRVWAAAVLPLQDTDAALEELDHAITRLGLVGVSLPGNIGGPEEALDAERLRPVYESIAALGVPIFLHPCDVGFSKVFQGYGGALNLSLGRVVDVSVSAYRLVLSGIMERHPDLIVHLSHTGGALPYQAGRMDKNSAKAGLPLPPSTYLRRMYTDTVSPHAMGVRFALEFYGTEHVMYGSDHPCWSPSAALAVLDEAGLHGTDHSLVANGNARRVLGLRSGVQAPA